ncbi:hybrid sensor histidine kinase/response regulator transcription factor [Spirosoma foliorum]|uniref:histidine kinase n=1 Tax=Spirosoma foliorum TaxID=2710596 RepID=A0A7G5GXE6_9BACT|nr:hybrid sensor histidine kinase/response regulator transcription factor [Spirosoma foliorum]QMW03538.1 response regulator [Spirosoma foliorum]
MAHYRQIALFLTLFFLTLVGKNAVSVCGQSITLPKPEAITSEQGLPQAFVPGIVQDRQGFIWMATRDGLCRYDGKQFKVFQPTTDGKPGISSLSLSGLGFDKQGRIWVFSDYNDIDIIDPVTEKFVNISRQPFFKQQLGQDHIHHHYVDQQGRLWICLRSNRIICIEPDTYRVQQYQYQAPLPLSSFAGAGIFVQDKQGIIWTCATNGLYRLDSPTKRFLRYPLPNNNVKGISIRPSGELFILLDSSVLLLDPQSGRTRSITLPSHEVDPVKQFQVSFVTDTEGNEYFYQYGILFHYNEAKGVSVLAKLPEGIGFESLFIDRSNVLWTGTNEVGVFKYNLNAGVFQAAPYQLNFYEDLFHRELGVPTSQLPKISPAAYPYFFRYTIDKAEKLWFNMGDRRFYQLDLNTKQVSPIPFPAHLLANSTWLDLIVPMATDPAGRVWAVTQSLAMWYENGRWVSFQYPIRAANPPDSSKQQLRSSLGVDGTILQVVIDNQAIWLATNTQGLYRIDRVSGQIRSYKNQPANPNSLSSNQLFCLFDDPLDPAILWVGTFGNGLCRFDKRTGTCRRFSTKTGLPNNVIYSAIPDKKGFLWIGTNQGLCRMDRRSFQTCVYKKEDGLLENEFNRFHFLHLPNDRILMGGLGGITSFYPSQLHDDTYQPLTQITDIQLNNQSISPGPLTDSLPVQAITHLDLPYNQNFITIDFAAMQYNRQGKIRYRYQLVGLDQQWIEPREPIVQYTDLRWGAYTLKLNTSNTSGIWSKHIREITLVIRPPWWATWWAILLYIFGIAALGYMLVNAYLTKQETRQLKAVDLMKARFFTNIAHEFRTPLTLILGPVETLKKRLHTYDDQYQLNLINQNAGQILELVNQLIDLSKAEANGLQLNESLGDLKSFVHKLVSVLEPQAKAKSIELTFQAEDMPPQYWFDMEKLERIINNLTVNALKFTPVGGKVGVDLAISPLPLGKSIPKNKEQTDVSWIQLSVSDNGIGIASENLPYIFDRFYQAKNNQIELLKSGQAYYLQQEGSGIGLALVKELVEFQSGTIQVTSTVNSGTTFIVRLPYRSVTTELSTPSVTAVKSATQPVDIEVEPVVQRIPKRKPTDKTSSILVVEDSEVLRDFIVNNLLDSYSIHQAENGLAGWELATSLVPDLIISDIMMPGMDGYTLCKKLKEDSRTNHIPVLLLTAKAAVNERLEGLALGADAYIAKPFHIQELQLRIRNLLEQRHQLQQWVLASLTSTAPVEEAPAPTDPLIEKLCQLVEERLDEPTFGAEELTLASGMSRMNLHRKLRALVDTSTGEFIRNYRLKRAAQFLREGHSVSETAYLVGFEDPSYFARSFRKVYKMSPSAFARTN